MKLTRLQKSVRRIRAFPNDLGTPIRLQWAVLRRCPDDNSAAPGTEQTPFGRRWYMGEATKALCTGLLALATLPCSGQAQTSGGAILRIDIANYVNYTYDVFDYGKFATV